MHLESKCKALFMHLFMPGFHQHRWCRDDQQMALHNIFILIDLLTVYGSNMYTIVGIAALKGELAGERLGDLLSGMKPATVDNTDYLKSW